MADDLKILGDVARSVVLQGHNNTVYVFPFEWAESVAASTRLFEAGVEASAGVNPYKGLLYFEEVDANRFFGREKLIEEVYRRFVDVARSDEGVLRILPVLGPSGSGKSSVIRAGLVPQLARERLSGLVEPRVLVLQPGPHPLEPWRAHWQDSRQATWQQSARLENSSRSSSLRAESMACAALLTDYQVQTRSS
jgi:hypothetical protein